MKKTRFTALILVIALLAAALTACAKTPEDMRKKADKKLTDKDYEVDVEVDFVCDNVTLDEIFKQLEKTETTVRVSDGKIYAKSDVMINYGDGNTSFTDEYTVIGNMMYLKMAYSEDGGVSKESRIKGEISNDDKDSFKNRIFFIGGIKADDFATVSETVNDDTLVTVYKDETEAARIVLENALLSMLENTASSVSARNVVMTVEIEDGAAIAEPTPYAAPLPIAFYGSSITEGAHASRPCNAYTAILSARLDTDYYNFGFSGNAKGQLPIADYICTLDISALVIDYDHNAPDPEFLQSTHEPFYRRVREQKPDLPIVFTTRPNFEYTPDADERRAVVRATYERARAAGDTNVYFIDGETFFGTSERYLCTTDATHPDDIGHQRMADVYAPLLADILGIS